MSETDDTDLLLIIPPNFFLVRSSGSEDSFLNSSRTVVQKPVSCTAQVIGKLVDQVQSLESRLEDLELDSSLHSSAKSKKCDRWGYNSCDSHSVERKYFTFPRRRRRKIKTKNKRESRDTSVSNIASSISNWDSKCNKSINSFVYSVNDTPSMDGDVSSIISTPSKNNDKLLLSEIDEFLTKVDSYESPESTLKKELSINPDNVIKATGEYISHKFDPASEVQLPSGRIIPINILDKYIYLVKNNQGHTNTNFISDHNYQTMKQDKSPSVRRLNFNDRDVQPTSTPKQTPQASTSCIDNFKPSSNKMYDRATKVFEKYNTSSSMTHNTLTDAKKEDFKLPQMRPYSDTTEALKIAAIQVDSVDTDLLSLSELWGEKGDNVERADSIKLEEERLKREHCEAMIQQLQKKILDQQEKLAVAMKVDKAKDTAISKLREAWLKLTNNLNKAEERHKAALEKMVREVDNFRTVADNAQKKTNHFEKELYKTLDLAHDYQEKCKQLNNEKFKMQEDMEKLLEAKNDCIHVKEKEIKVLKDNYETVMRLNKQSTDHVKNLEDAIEKEKKDHEETKTKVIELRNKVQSANDDKEVAEQERNVLKEKVNEERSRCGVVERQLGDTQSQLRELYKKCDLLENETKTLRKHLELQKTELKSHYQQQLEDAVLGKLQEFQHQLDHAQKEMEDAARSREATLIDNYNKQIVRIEEQHKLEVNVLEEKQREEIKLYRLQLAQASEKIGLLENKVESWKRRRGEMAAQLHAVMQAQWTQALRILTRPQPPSHSAYRSTHQLPHASQHAATARAHNDQSHQRYALFDDTGRDTVTPIFQDYGVSSAAREELAASVEGLGDSELQRYIDILLTKKPNFELFESTPDAKELSEEPTSDRPDVPDRPDRRDRVRRSLGSKPPWKA